MSKKITLKELLKNKGKKLVSSDIYYFCEDCLITLDIKPYYEDTIFFCSNCGKDEEGKGDNKLKVKRIEEKVYKEKVYSEIK